jgi:hypothetical protein
MYVDGLRNSLADASQVVWKVDANTVCEANSVWWLGTLLPWLKRHVFSVASVGTCNLLTTSYLSLMLGVDNYTYAPKRISLVFNPFPVYREFIASTAYCLAQAAGGDF